MCFWVPGLPFETFWPSGASLAAFFVFLWLWGIIFFNFSKILGVFFMALGHGFLQNVFKGQSTRQCNDAAVLRLACSILSYYHIIILLYRYIVVLVYYYIFLVLYSYVVILFYIMVL